MQVLIVDDDADIGDVLIEALLFEGYRPMRVPSGEAALKLLELGSERPCAILADQRLPGMSGAELIIHLQKLCVNAPIALAVMSADHSAIGCPPDVHFFRKPFDLDALLGWLRTSCGPVVASPS
jgi:two-component system, cell cycle sensor histidine kinase and response regulator CckA